MKREKFLEKWAQAQESKTYLGITLLGSLIFSGALLFVFVKEVARPKPIYYIPGAKEAGVALPNRVDKGSVIGFAQSWLLNWTNFNHLTIDDVYAQALKFLDPQLLSRMRAVQDRQIGQIKRNSISSIFTLVQDPEVKEDSRGYSVTFKGKKSVYVGRESIKVQDIKYEVYLKKVPPTESNPYGMVIKELKQEEVKA